MPKAKDIENSRKDDSFLEDICQKTWKELYRFIYYRVQNREEAEDITQETYVKAISYLNKNEIRIIEYNNYFKAIAINIIRDHWRARKRKGYPLNIEDINPEEIAADDFSDHVDNRALIEKAMESLTSDQQTVITLRIIKGFSAAETAKLMHKKESTVRVLQFRAIKALAENIKDTNIKGGVNFG